jgi:hypothetical protein
MNENRRVSVKGAFLALALVGSIGSAMAQEPPRGEVVYAEGREFSVVRGGVVRTLKVDDPEAIGLRIETGDLVQTKASTFVEIQLVPQGTVLKLAENSSFMFKGLGNEGEAVSLGLVYGRVRAKVSKLSGSETFSIRSGGTVAGVRGTDFGFDAIARPADRSGGTFKQPDVSVYCFSGEVAVAPVAEIEKEAEAPVVIVKANELVAVDRSSEVPLVERRPIDVEIKSFWITHEFQGETPVPPPVAVPIAAPEKKPEVEIRYIEPDYSKYRRAAKNKNMAIAGAVLFGAIGFGLQMAAIPDIADGGSTYTGAGLLTSGSICFGFSLSSLVLSYFINPPSP